MARCGWWTSTPSPGSAPGRPGPTRSERPLPARDDSEALRETRARLVVAGPSGAEFSRAWADALDAAWRDAARTVSLTGRWALVALGSYARRELCPGSDVDVMILHDGGARGAAGIAAAEALWYPVWDAGVVLGHAVRTPKEALELAAAELEVLTGLLEPRVVIGDETLVTDLATRARHLAVKRRGAVVDALSAASAVRAERPGAIAEMLEPNLKDGAGGLRDLQSLEWVGWTLGEPGGIAALVASGFLRAADPDRLEAARTQLLDARVALQRITGGRSDVLTLQEQDAVASALRVRDADELVQGLARVTRTVTWIAGDVWRRLRDAGRGPIGRLARRDRALTDGVVVRDGVVTLTAEAEIDVVTVLEAAGAAARLGAPIERASLERMGTLTAGPWSAAARSAFVALLRVGPRAIPVLEALDQVGVLEALIPEWAHVRARPQRNAYHRHTVDRHLLEAVAESTQLLDRAGADGDVARGTRVDLLLLGALFHDLGKGLEGDHAEAGAAAARTIANRIGLDEHGVEVLGWLVRHHLLLAETATRRDLTDEETIVRFGRAVHDTERLDLLYALTVADSRATGPAAWSSPKAALVRELFVKTDELLERGVVSGSVGDERRAALADHRNLLARGELAVDWAEREDGLLECTVVAPDRTGLLSTVAGVLALHGFDIRAASVYGDESGMALEVYRGVDRFGRLAGEGRARVAADVRAAVDGELHVREQLEARIRRYARRDRPPDEGVRVGFDLQASSAATVVEVHAPDEVGLLARVAAVFADLDLDVTAALVSTLGDRVVDVFYVRDVHGAKLTEPLALDRLRATLVARLTADALLT